MFYFKYLARELFSERTRMFLTILAIAWGTASVTLMLSLGEGLRLTFSKSTRSMGEGILIVRAGKTSRSYNGIAAGQQIFLDKQDLDAVCKAVPEIDQISGEYSKGQVAMRNGRKWRAGILMGVDSNFGAMRHIRPEVGGRFIDPLDIQQCRRVAVIGPNVAADLFDHPNATGQWISIDQRAFRVIGVMQKKFQISSYNGADADGVWIPSTTFQVMYGAQHYQNWVIKPRHTAQTNHAKAKVRQVIARRHHLDAQDEDFLSFWDTQRTQQTTDTVLSGFQAMLGIVGSLTLIVAGVGIANVMYISVGDATREIGIRMAIGAKNYQVLLHYVLECLVATGVGGIVGLLTSWSIIAAVRIVPFDVEFFEVIGKPLPVFSPIVAGIVIGVLGAIGFLAGVFPAKKAANIMPTEALRYE